MNTEPKMKTFIIEEKFIGYADIKIEAETEEEAIALYNRGYYETNRKSKTKTQRKSHL